MTAEHCQRILDQLSTRIQRAQPQRWTALALAHVAHEAENLARDLVIADKGPRGAPEPENDMEGIAAAFEGEAEAQREQHRDRYRRRGR